MSDRRARGSIPNSDRRRQHRNNLTASLFKHFLHGANLLFFLPPLTLLAVVLVIVTVQVRRPTSTASEIRRCARGVRTCVIISDPLSIRRASFVVVSERANERTNERTSGCQRLGIFPRQVSLGHPYRVDTTKAGQRRVFDCVSRVLQSELTRN